ncbi:MAG: PIN domain-containing protein [Spirochaetaceae bacterium]|nr:PIN domain-containing protein [Spirochaetaceae bacterium]
MRAVTHVLDTSAILAHYFDEPGAEMVERLWYDSVNRIAVCVLSLPELKGRLTVEVDDPQEVERAFRQYVGELTTTLIVDRRTADSAMLLRESADTRLPLVDAGIAGCAHVHSAVLVHRDPHLASISRELVAQVVLPEKDTSTESSQ